MFALIDTGMTKITAASFSEALTSLCVEIGLWCIKYHIEFKILPKYLILFLNSLSQTIEGLEPPQKLFKKEAFFCKCECTNFPFLMLTLYWWGSSRSKFEFDVLKFGWDFMLKSQQPSKSIDIADFYNSGHMMKVVLLSQFFVLRIIFFVCWSNLFTVFERSENLE